MLAELESIYRRLPDGRWYIVLHHANHFSFSDQVLLNSPVAIYLLQHIMGMGRSLDGRRGLTISADTFIHFSTCICRVHPPIRFNSLLRNIRKFR